MTGLKSIVVGIDFSDCSRVALGHAEGTQGHLHLRDVVLVSTAEKVLRDSTVAVRAAKP